MEKYCNTCGHVSHHPEARYCGCCGLKLAIKPDLKLVGTAELTVISGAVIALIGGLLTLFSSIHFSQFYGFNPVVTTFFVTSLFAIAGFFYSVFGITMILRKKDKQIG